MKFSRSTKFTLLFIALFSLAACSSTSEEASNEVVAETESGIDATTRRTQELEAEARARAAAATDGRADARKGRRGRRVGDWHGARVAAAATPPMHSATTRTTTTAGARSMRTTRT